MASGNQILPLENTIAYYHQWKRSNEKYDQSGKAIENCENAFFLQVTELQLPVKRGQSSGKKHLPRVDHWSSVHGDWWSSLGKFESYCTAVQVIENLPLTGFSRATTEQNCTSCVEAWRERLRSILSPFPPVELSSPVAATLRLFMSSGALRLSIMNHY